jgi:ubiquinone/menaquinone biosynthesis C-methylase UbiE
MIRNNKQDAEKSKVRDVFSEDADAYYESYVGRDSRRAFVFQRRREIVLGLLKADSGKVLDIGSGPAVYTAQLLDRGNEVWTVDISEKMVQMAEEMMKAHPRFQQAHFQVGDVENLEFNDKFFDSILCVGVIEYLDKPDRALREMARLLKPGGEVVITGPNRKSPIYRMNTILASVANLLFGYLVKRFRDRLFYEYNFQHQVFDPDELDKHIQLFGLEISDRRYSNYQIGLLRGPFDRLNQSLSRWAEQKLAGTGTCWERLGTNYMVRAIRIS